MKEARIPKIKQRENEIYELRTERNKNKKKLNYYTNFRLTETSAK